MKVKQRKFIQSQQARSYAEDRTVKPGDHDQDLWRDD
jgi:hypothetical protein|tara:strand:- start:1218 stop:1328 length:111 start_codon:yes stop_codon:yes gene_type:complete